MQAALFYVLKESFKVYKAVSEGLINLADKFFDMDYFDAQKALEIYKESILSAERLQVSAAAAFLSPLPGNRHMPILVVRIT
jgi:hypothetical protein